MTVTVNSQTAHQPGCEQLARLVRSAAAGDEQSWVALVRQFDKMMWAIARAHRLRHADAADVVQATWLKLLAHIGNLNDPARVGAWLGTTARRECLRVLRDGQKRVLFGDDTPDLESADTPPEAELLIEERDSALWSSFARLRPNDQVLLRLLMADSPPSYQEISDAMEIPVGSIGPTRQRALDRLRDELQCTESLTLLTA